jgi:hypothetical protein
VTPVQSGNDCAVRERKLPFAVGLDRYIVAQNGTQTVEVAFFVGHGDQLPVAVSVRDFVHEDRGGLFIGLSRCGGDVGDPAGQRCNGNQQDSDPSQTVSSQKAEGARGVQNFFELRHDVLLV